MTHAALSKDEKQLLGITDTLIRLCFMRGCHATQLTQIAQTGKINECLSHELYNNNNRAIYLL
jgi:hypothetical protein